MPVVTVEIVKSRNTGTAWSHRIRLTTDRGKFLHETLRTPQTAAEVLATDHLSSREAKANANLKRSELAQIERDVLAGTADPENPTLHEVALTEAQAHLLGVFVRSEFIDALKIAPLVNSLTARQIETLLGRGAGGDAIKTRASDLLALETDVATDDGRVERDG